MSRVASRYEVAFIPSASGGHKALPYKRTARPRARVAVEGRGLSPPALPAAILQAGNPAGGPTAHRPQSFPKLRIAPQSGHVQLIPLQVIPQKFSSMQSEQIIKPHRQVQQKGCSCEQVEHTYFSGRRHLPLRPDFSKPLICHPFTAFLQSLF